MKKIYVKPYVETTNMRFNYVICGTVDNNNKPGNSEFNFSPKRRVF